MDLSLPAIRRLLFIFLGVVNLTLQKKWRHDNHRNYIFILYISSMYGSIGTILLPVL